MAQNEPPAALTLESSSHSIKQLHNQSSALEKNLWCGRVTWPRRSRWMDRTCVIMQHNLLWSNNFAIDLLKKIAKSARCGNAGRTNDRTLSCGFPHNKSCVNVGNSKSVDALQEKLASKICYANVIEKKKDFGRCSDGSACCSNRSGYRGNSGEGIIIARKRKRGGALHTLKNRHHSSLAGIPNYSIVCLFIWK
jgi:hypothetical protein